MKKTKESKWVVVQLFVDQLEPWLNAHAWYIHTIYFQDGEHVTVVALAEE